jgi:hypothetical protein
MGERERRRGEQFEGKRAETKRFCRATKAQI